MSELLLHHIENAVFEASTNKWQSEPSWYAWDEMETAQSTILGEIKLIANVGGGEGSGETRYLVFEIGGKFYQMNGYYMSFDGSHFDGPFIEVTPIQKTITVYEEMTGADNW